MSADFENLLNNARALVQTGPTLVEAGVDHVLFVENPKCRRADGADADYYELAKTADLMEMEIERVPTSPHQEENEDMLAAHLRNSSALAIRGGDGTISNIANARRQISRTPQSLFVAKRLANIAELPLLIIPGGNANDLAHALFKPSTFNDPGTVLADGTIEDIFGLDLLVEPDDAEPFELSALAYASIGITGLGSAMLNSKEYKEKRMHKIPGGTLVGEKIAVGKAFFQAEPFEITAGKSSGSYVELIMACIPRMAKVFRPSVRTFEPEARFITAQDKIDGVTAIGALTTGMPIGKMMDEDTVVRLHVKGESMYFQVDGEEYLIKGGANITAKIGDPVPVVKTRRAVREL